MCSGKALQWGAAGNTGPEPGDFDPATYRPAAPAAHRRGGLLVGGLDCRYHSRHWAQEPDNDCRNGGSVSRRQALAGSVGLSFMR